MPMHGKGKRPVRPLPRHTELAVNLAGSVALFVVATYESKKQSLTPVEFVSCFPKPLIQLDKFLVNFFRSATPQML